jgi:hypothetical protein
MANKSKAAGTDAENRVRDYAIDRGYLYADRLTLSGVKDRGDIRLGDGIDFTIEVKGGQGALNNPHSHLREMKAELLNNGHRFGAVVTKKPGSRQVGDDWVAMMPVAMLFDIIDALYRPAPG